MRLELHRLFRRLCEVVVVATLMAFVAPADAATRTDTNAAGVTTSPQGAGTVARKAVKLLAVALRSPGMPRVIAFLSRQQATTEQVGLVVKYAASTAKILDELVKWDQLTLAVVRGQVDGGLVKLGVAASDASRVAYWIEKALDWGL